MNYTEHEIKVLDINPTEFKKKLLELGATEVFSDDRTITHFDYKDGSLRATNQIVKLTEEGKLKLSHTTIVNGQQETIKLVVSRKQETLDFLSRLGLFPITQVKAHRISYEWQGIDFDIDEFPHIPTFLEIDLGDSPLKLTEIIATLGLTKNDAVEMSTPDVYKKYDKDYFSENSKQ